MRDFSAIREKYINLCIMNDEGVIVRYLGSNKKTACGATAEDLNGLSVYDCMDPICADLLIERIKLCIENKYPVIHCSWVNFKGKTVYNARLIIPYKENLVFLCKTNILPLEKEKIIPEFFERSARPQEFET